jgi:hypothetical protein
MPTSIILRDERLEGGATPVSLAGDFCLNLGVGKYSPLVNTFIRARGFASAFSDMNNLYIMAHSYCRDIKRAPRWGGGVELGLETLNRQNVSVMGLLQGVFKSIVIFSCCTGYTFPGEEQSPYDGVQFCRDIAIVTGTPVIAATDLQEYNSELFLHWGNWEGKIYKFYPDGRVKAVPADYLAN